MEQQLHSLIAMRGVVDSYGRLGEKCDVPVWARFPTYVIIYVKLPP